MIDLHRVQFVLELLELRRIRCLLQAGRVVVRLEGLVNVFGIVDEIEHKGGLLARQHAVEARQGLNRLHPIQALVHIHCHQQRLVESGLVFVGYQQDLIVRRGEALGQLLFADLPAVDHIDIQARLGVLLAGFRVLHRTAERHQRPHVLVAAQVDVALKSFEVFHGLHARGGYDHGFGAPAQMVHHMAPEVLHDYFDLLLDIGGVQDQELGQDAGSLLFRQVGVVFDLFDQPEIGFIGGVVFNHIQDVTLLDGLTHAVQVKGLRFAAVADPAEQLQGLALGRGRKGKKADVGLWAA